jgi:hypothetical protein
MNTLADLKRVLILGARVETVAQVGGGAPNARMAGIRTVKKVQTNGVYLSKSVEDSGSFFEFGKVGDWTINGNEFTNTDGRSYRIAGAE